ncbi:hypothetical protein [Nostoc sp. PA-18-2419]|uniref:hypothetical protein n=1 Tax=Nostoc sp. PA-18-2419 TaxID=2575443 RepID=UPI001CB8D60C|nr:hypothetical protein [Nostoc sp. PA-18-2419]
MVIPHRPPILKPSETYTFRRYFDLRFAPADILRELDASLTKTNINFPVSNYEITPLGDLKQRLEEAITRVSFTSEAARREVLIAPILLEVAHITQAIINIEATSPKPNARTDGKSVGSFGATERNKATGYCTRTHPQSRTPRRGNCTVECRLLRWQAAVLT